MHSRRITMSKKKGSLPVSAGSLLVLIGGVLAIASYFLGWLTFSTPQGLIIDGTSTTFTGGDVFSGFAVTVDGSEISIPADNMSFARLMPMLVLVFGVLGVIVSLIPMITKGCGKPIAAVQVLFGLLIVVFAAIFAFAGAGPDLFTGSIATFLKGFIDLEVLSISAAVGVWIGLAGGVVALIGGGLSLKDAS